MRLTEELRAEWDSFDGAIFSATTYQKIKALRQSLSADVTEVERAIQAANEEVEIANHRLALVTRYLELLDLLTGARRSEL